MICTPCSSATAVQGRRGDCGAGDCGAGERITVAKQHTSNPCTLTCVQVLIDEAAQAAEVSALQPLVYGASDVVLVGDPQQVGFKSASCTARTVCVLHCGQPLWQLGVSPPEWLRYNPATPSTQLPATIFSNGAREVAMERSLFQRLAAAGCPVRPAG